MGNPRMFGTWELILARVEKQDFDTYFRARLSPMPLKSQRFWESRKPVPLNAGEGSSQTSVPQSWRYVREEEHQFFLEMKPQTKEVLKQCEKKTQLLHFQHTGF